MITDSTACLPGQLAAQWGVAVVQVQIEADGRLDDESRYDRGELIELIRTGHDVRTRPPDPGAFFWTFQDAVSAGADAIVSVHLSRRMSATAEAATQAARQVEVPVHVVDSATTGMSLGFAALSAARTAAAGAAPERVVDAAERRASSAGELIYVDTLEYLRRGGRIGAASALLGGALSLRPVLTVREGEVAPMTRVPGTKRALNRLADLAATHAGDRPVDVAVACVTRSDREMTLIRRLRERIPRLNDIMLVEGSTVIIAHVGPGALGVTIAPTL